MEFFFSIDNQFRFYNSRYTKLLLSTERKISMEYFSCRNVRTEAVNVGGCVEGWEGGERGIGLTREKGF